VRWSERGLARVALRFPGREVGWLVEGRGCLRLGDGGWRGGLVRRWDMCGWVGVGGGYGEGWMGVWVRGKGERRWRMRGR